MSAANHEVHERDFALAIRLLVVGAAGAITFAALVALGALAGGSIAAIAAAACAVLALLGARRLAALRKRTGMQTKNPVPAEPAVAPGLSPWVAYGPPLLITGAIAGGFGYLVGGLVLAVLLGGGAALLVFHGLRAPPLAPTSQSPILRQIRRLSRLR